MLDSTLHTLHALKYHNKPMRAIYSLFYSSGNRDTEKLGNLLKITQFSKNFQANLC